MGQQNSNYQPQGGYYNNRPQTFGQPQYGQSQSFGMGQPFGMPNFTPQWGQMQMPSLPSGMAMPNTSPVQMGGVSSSPRYGMGMTNTAPSRLPQPMGYPAPPAQPTPSPDFGPSYGGAFPSTGQSPTSAAGAAQMAVQDYSSPQYAAYYNSQPASTRAFLHAPGNARLGNYLGQQAGQAFNEFNGMQDPFAFALKGY